VQSDIIFNFERLATFKNRFNRFCWLVSNNKVKKQLISLLVCQFKNLENGILVLEVTVCLIIIKGLSLFFRKMHLDL